MSDAQQAGWQAALAATVVDPRQTVTRAHLAALESAATLAAPPRLQPRARALPRLDLALPRGEDAPNDPDADLAVGRLLAEGGMGRVYLAEQRSLAREVAIKTVRDPLDDAQVEALLWEGTVAGHLDHPGVTPVHLLGASQEGQPLLVMKRIVGTRWSDLIGGDDEVWARFPTLPSNRLRAHLDVLMEVARTIHYSHRRGVLHLDIKPDNVMIGELGEVYVVDWGVAVNHGGQELRSGFVGTPIFVAPEVVAGEPIGPWTDVYLLGATLHWVLTGLPRHSGEGLLAILASATRSAPWAYSPELPRELAELANLATHRDPGMRPIDALAFRAAVAAHLEHTASLALARDGEALLGRVERAAKAEDALRLAAEARFAFRAALQRWEGCAEARDGLVRCLERAARLELDRENLPAALDLERELEAPSTELVARRQALEVELAARTASADALRALRHDADLDLGSRERFKLLGGLVALALFGLTALSLINTVGALERLLPLVPLLGGLVTFAVAVFWLRRGLLANAAGRRVVLFFLFMIVFLGAQRGATLFFPLDAAATEVRSELLLSAALTFGLATFMTARAFFVPVIAVAGAALVTRVPENADHIFNGAAILMLVGLIAVLGRDRRSSRAALTG